MGGEWVAQLLYVLSRYIHNNLLHVLQGIKLVKYISVEDNAARGLTVR